ncbi:uncharacterized protein CIMG_11451 [Coccidioides immitis RS]|uniref:Uncharacterized protein n=1 Tax=Coccidioides immitis (strain RS) TaxID=246410 RepID=A0A0D8JUR9_COCIM|nr:uncharacterized protein CIMG_11451 [Coccidioides immitis RS]KJF61080.1 hypothetical protein CIMG_11451 [Coccidioides immitis RS]
MPALQVLPNECLGNEKEGLDCHGFGSRLAGRLEQQGHPCMPNGPLACVGLRTYKFPLKAVCSTALAEHTPGGAIHYPWENIRRSTNASTASSRSQFPQGTNPRPALIASSKDSGVIIHTHRLLGLA